MTSTPKASERQESVDRAAIVTHCRALHGVAAIAAKAAGLDPAAYRLTITTLSDNEHFKIGDGDAMATAVEHHAGANAFVKLALNRAGLDKHTHGKDDDMRRRQVGERQRATSAAPC